MTRPARLVAEPGGRDRGSALLLVLVLVIIAGFVVLPLMRYTIAVNRSSGVESDKARATETARGATRVALSDARGLFDSCPSAGFADSLDDVTTRCEVVATARLVPDSEVPYSAAVVQADATLPPSISTAAPFETGTSAYDSWLTAPGWTPASEVGKVWLPQLADRVATNGNASRTTMTTDPTCEVFFPGTYPSEVRIAGTAYFASGVYYFREPLILENGADVVVGNGTELGCTSDPFVVDAVSLPTPLNMSGYGATIVFGENGRLVVEDDDAGAGDISFVVNQRLVPPGDDTIAASERVSIVAVSGTHLPLVGSEAIGDDLLVDGVIAVLGSTVDDDGDPTTIETTPTAEARGFSPSINTPKPLPIAPAAVTALLEGKNAEAVPDGVVVVEWTDPNPADIDVTNGVRVIGYDVTAYDTADNVAATCSVTPGAGGALQDFCAFGTLTLGDSYTFDVESVVEHHLVAGQAFDPVVSARSGQARPQSSSPLLFHPNEPFNIVVVEEYATGVEIGWNPPTVTPPDPAISRYVVTATDTGGNIVNCEAAWNEDSCILEPLVPAETYEISVLAVNRINESHEHPGLLTPPFAFTGTDPDPVPPVVAPVLPVRVPEPIIDLRMGTSAAVTIDIAGYVSVPQGHVAIDAGPVDASNKSVTMTGGLVAGQILLGAEPATTTLGFANPIAQKTIRLISETSSSYRARSEAVVQINTSGSYAINSWFVQ